MSNLSIFNQLQSFNGNGFDLGGLQKLSGEQKSKAPGGSPDIAKMIDNARVAPATGNGCRSCAPLRGDTLSISATAMNLSVQYQNGQMAVKMSRQSLSLSITASGPQGLGVMNRGEIKNLLDTMYSFAGATPPAEGAELTAPPSAVIDYWNAENTGTRIADFSLSYYNIWAEGREDSADLRQAYVDWIGKAVQQGFDEAAPFVSGISDEIDQKVQGIHDKIWEIFSNFVKNGLDRSEQENRSIIQSGLDFLNYTRNLPDRDGGRAAGSSRDTAKSRGTA